MNEMSLWEVVFWCVLVVLLRNQAVKDFVGRAIELAFFGLAFAVLSAFIINGLAQFLQVLFHLR